MEYDVPEAAQLALEQMNSVMLGGRNIKVSSLIMSISQEPLNRWKWENVIFLHSLARLIQLLIQFVNVTFVWVSCEIAHVTNFSLFACLSFDSQVCVCAVCVGGCMLSVLSVLCVMLP